MAPSPASEAAPWWKGAVIYQIYPRSFQDSNGDGVGDLRGITERLDHVAALGADALWVTPFYPSPMDDFGYDVADYCDVDPRFGTLDDFKALVARAHALGLKVLIDLVLSHTSDRHPWFIDSRAARNGPRANWYVWADGTRAADGSPQPPNNWVSLFGGSAWQWDEGRGQFYLHNFFTSQPDLNFHEPAVQEAVLAVMRFWLELGVDGFRLDVANYYFHDPLLRDNPPAGAMAQRADGLPEGTPYGAQRHEYDKSRPENLAMLARMRALADSYPACVLLAEIGDDDAIGRMAEYTAGAERLHMAYSFHLLGERFSSETIGATLRQFEARMPGWPCWSLNNHDVPRVASRWSLQEYGDAALKALMAMLLSLRGSVCLYQGEELGLLEAVIARADLQDPFGIKHWPALKGRDGCRTPMPWAEQAPLGGFTSADRAWLPVPPEHLARAVDVQTSRPDSLLNAYRRFLAWRRAQPALRTGSLDLWQDEGGVLAWLRSSPSQRLFAAFNLSPQPQRTRPFRLVGWTAASGHGLDGDTPVELHADGSITLPAWGVFYADGPP